LQNTHEIPASGTAWLGYRHLLLIQTLHKY
jgi:hypothetical protein